jgi:hypothetical protein
MKCHNTWHMETTFKKKSMRSAVLSVGMMFIASFASLTHPGLANAQQNKTLMQPHGVQSRQQRMPQR